MPIGTFTFCSLLTVPPGAAFAVAGRPASSSPQVSARPASTRQCSASGVFRAGRCVVGVDIAPNDERRADVPEIRTFRRHPAERRQARQEGGEREQERTEDDVRTVKQANTSRFMPSYQRLATPSCTSASLSASRSSRSPPSWRSWRPSAGAAENTPIRVFLPTSSRRTLRTAPYLGLPMDSRHGTARSRCFQPPPTSRSSCTALRAKRADRRDRGG